MAEFFFFLVSLGVTVFWIHKAIVIGSRALDVLPFVLWLPLALTLGFGWWLIEDIRGAIKKI